jgi:hypothetical protein
LSLTTAQQIVASLVLTIEVACVVVTAWLVGRRAAQHDPLLRALVVALVGLAQPIGIALLLGMVDLLRTPAVFVGHLALTGAVVVIERPRRARTEPWQPTKVGLCDASAIGATTAYAVLGVYLGLTGGRSREFDTQEYHIANIASWLQRANIWHLPYAEPGSVTATHPSNGELLAAWLGLPTHGDQLMYLMPVAFGVLAVLAAAVIARELSGGARGAAGIGAIAGVAVLTAPVYLAQVDSLLTDVVAASALAAAVALLLVARRRPDVVWLAGVALGIGLGSKYTATVPAALIALAAIVWLRSRQWWWLVPGTVFFAAPWFVRNLVTTGNPLFPQDLKIVRGADTPYNILNTSMLHHIVHGDRSALSTWLRLGRTAIGPIALFLIVGVVLAVQRVVARREWTGAVPVFGALTVLAFGAYLATPVTGGGPTGLAFIIDSCFRYGLVAMLFGGILGAVLLPRWLAAGALALVLAWNAWHVNHSGRADLHISRSVLAASIAVGVLAAVGAVAGVAWIVGRRSASLRAFDSNVTAAVFAGALAVLLLGTFVAVRHNDRGRQTTELEKVALSFGADRPAVVLGVTDLRAVLGPRLERPLRKVSRGGAADERPFADDNQMLRRVLGTPTPPPPPELGVELDRAIDATGLDLLIIGSTSPAGYPDGWVPARGWCLVGGDAEGTVFVRPTLLAPGQPCVPALEPQPSPQGATIAVG